MDDEVESNVRKMRDCVSRVMHVAELIANKKELDMLRDSSAWSGMVRELDGDVKKLPPYSLMTNSDRIKYDHILFIKWRMHELDDAKNKKIVKTLMKLI